MRRRLMVAVVLIGLAASAAAAWLARRGEEADAAGRATELETATAAALRVAEQPGAARSPGLTTEIEAADAAGRATELETAIAATLRVAEQPGAARSPGLTPKIEVTLTVIRGSRLYREYREGPGHYEETALYRELRRYMEAGDAAAPQVDVGLVGDFNEKMVQAKRFAALRIAAEERWEACLPHAIHALDTIRGLIYLVRSQRKGPSLKHLVEAWPALELILAVDGNAALAVLASYHSQRPKLREEEQAVLAALTGVIQARQRSLAADDQLAALEAALLGLYRAANRAPPFLHR